MKGIIFISFDHPRSEYPSMSYSIASLIAALKEYGFSASHFPIDIKQIQTDSNGQDIPTTVLNRLESNIEWFMGFEYISLSVTRWSLSYCNEFAKRLKDRGYKGNIVFGGYEITACKNENLRIEFPYADYYTKGYAENQYVKLLKGEYKESADYILQEKVTREYLVSPYLNNVLPLNSRKIYWETKRGCSFNCDFCEWGALEGEERMKPIELDVKRLKDEIDIIAKSNVEEINILDGTFNSGSNYMEMLKYIMEHSNLKVVCQSRFEALTNEYLDLCEKYKERIHLEFGLQTIHEKEMATIGRRNNMPKVEESLKILHKKGIDYEVSIIYAIPGQTMESFIDTVEFLLINKCTKIRAFALQIARNSKLATKEKMAEWCIELHTDANTQITTVGSSKSFLYETRRDMDLLAERIIFDKSLFDGSHKTAGMILDKCEGTNYLYKVKLEGEYDKEMLYNLIEQYYENPTSEDFRRIDRFAAMMLIGQRYDENTSDILQRINPSFCHEIKRGLINDYAYNNEWYSVPKPTHDYKFFCELRVGESGNIYVFRRIERYD